MYFGMCYRLISRTPIFGPENWLFYLFYPKIKFWWLIHDSYLENEKERVILDCFKYHFWNQHPRKPQNTLETIKTQITRKKFYDVPMGSSRPAFGRLWAERPKFFSDDFSVILGVFWGFSGALSSKMMLKIFYNDSFPLIFDLWLIENRLTRLINSLKIVNFQPQKWGCGILAYSTSESTCFKE